jgi:hypothetical protein
MTDRQDPGGGGLTGATGDLTPAESDEPFVPAERREQEGERAQGSVTFHQASSAPAQLGDVGNPGGDESGGQTNLAERASGYGSEHGLSPNDPAYRVELDPSAGPDARTSDDPARQQATRQGSDDVTDREERF